MAITTLGHALLTGLLMAGTGLFGLLALQRQLLYPAPKRQTVLRSPHHRIETVRIPVAGGWLQGHLAVPHTAPLAAGGLLYFNGRRENPTSIFRCLADMPGLHVACFRYRKLGLALGKPDETRLVQDALQVLDWMGQRCGMADADIAIGGRSLGSGLAVQVSAARPVRRLVLVSPFDQMLSAVRVRLPFVREWMLKDRFRSVDHIHGVRCPVLLIVGTRDRTVPPAVSRRLFRGWHGQLHEHVVHDIGHRGLLRRADVHQRIADFCR